MRKSGPMRTAMMGQILRRSRFWIRTACVNRTPIAGEMTMYRDKSEVDVFGCGLSHILRAGCAR